MNNKVIFAIGLLAGAGIGSVATYFGLKRHFDAVIDQEIEDYAERCTERINDLMAYYEGGKDAEESVEDDNEPEDAPEPEEYRHNEGVKKYHHYANSSDGNVQSIFSKDNVKEVAGAVRFKSDEERNESYLASGRPDMEEKEVLDVVGIEELTGDQYDVICSDPEDDRTIVTLSFNCNDGKLVTNEGVPAEVAYGKTRTELIGNFWRWATDYWNKKPENEDFGYFFIDNKNLGIVFQVVVEWDPDEEMVDWPEN